MAWKTVSSSYPFRTPFFSVRDDDCLLPEGKRINYYTIEARDWAGGIVVREDGRFVLTKQYRHPVGEVLIETPAGYVDRDETPEGAVRREILEETGFSVTEVVPLGVWFSDPGRQLCRAHFFFARVAGSGQQQSLDDEEDIGLLFRTGSEVLSMIRSGEICGGVYIAGLYAAKERFPELFR